MDGGAAPVRLPCTQVLQGCPDAVRDVSSTHDPDREGYSNRLLTGGSFLTRRSHRSRMDRSLRMLGGSKFATAADVGAADGWYLRTLVEQGVVGEGVAIDTDAEALQLAATRVATLPLSFLTPDDPTLQRRHGTFDLVACLETLEHAEDVSAVLDEVVNLARPAGTILISVPVEVGPSVVVKQAGRWLANRGGSYSYERYTWRELWAAGARWKVDGLERQNLHSHKGFDFRKVKKQVDERVAIVSTAFSPASFLGPVLASTVYWLGSKRT